MLHPCLLLLLKNTGLYNFWIKYDDISSFSFKYYYFRRHYFKNKNGFRFGPVLYNTHPMAHRAALPAAGAGWGRGAAGGGTISRQGLTPSRRSWSNPLSGTGGHRPSDRRSTKGVRSDSEQEQQGRAGQERGGSHARGHGGHVLAQRTGPGAVPRGRCHGVLAHRA